MWAIVVVTLGMLSGPEALPIVDAGTFATEDACKVALGAAVPGSLDANVKADYEQGYRRYVCIKVMQPPALHPAG
jgi:hypothetical protein